MSDAAALPKIKVIDAHNLEGSAGTSGVDSPSNTTDGGQSGRPRSATSSEGMFPFVIVGLLVMWKAVSVLPKMFKCYGSSFSLLRSC
jgi:hypothetical protein